MADVNVFDNQGNPQTIDSAELPALQRTGWRIATPQEVRSTLLQEKQGGVGTQLRTGLESAASGATFGGSDILARGMGANMQEMAERREANPISSTVGNIAGSTLGIAALPELGLGRVATSAIHGAALGAGNVVSEAALGDPDLNAQKAISEIGLSALFGAGVGVLAKGIPKGANMLNEGIEGAKGKFNDVMEKYIPTAGEQAAPDALSEEGGKFDPFTKKPYTSVDKTKSIADMFEDEGSFKDALVRKVSDFDPSILSKLKGAASTMFDLSHIGRALNAVTGMASFIEKADNALSTQAKSVFTAGATATGIDTMSDRDYTKAITNLSALQDPNNFINHMEHNLGPLHQSMPNTTPFMQAAMQRGISFLASKIPAQPTHYPLDEKWDPTPDQKNKFASYYNTVNNPMGLLKQIKQGTLSNESMEAMVNVYPRLLDEMRAKVAENMKQPANYAAKIALAKFMAQPMDSFQTPASVAANQAAIQSPVSQMGQRMTQKHSTTLGGLKELKMGSRHRTQTEKEESDV